MVTSPTLDHFFVNAQGWLQKGLNVLELFILISDKIIVSKQVFRVNPLLDTQLFAIPATECTEHKNQLNT